MHCHTRRPFCLLIAFATEVIDSKSPIDAAFDVPEYVNTFDSKSWKSKLGLISQV